MSESEGIQLIKPAKRCACCNKKLSVEKTGINRAEDQYFCNKCYRTLFYKCTECGDIVRSYKSDLDVKLLIKVDTSTLEKNFHTTESGSLICLGCYDEHYFTCSHCERVFDLDDSYEQDGEEYCGDCWNELWFNCNACDGTFSREEEHCQGVGGGDYCQECWSERFANCDDCGLPFHRENLVFDEETERYSCASCRGEVVERVGDSPVNNGERMIHDYSFKPTLAFKKEKWENTLFMGVELEVQHNDGDLNTVATKLNRFLNSEEVKDTFYFKNDSSIGHGFEIVSHPFTLKYAHKHLKFKKILNWLEKNKFQSFQPGTCGIHIHLNGEFFEELDKTKLRLFFSKNQTYLDKFSRREGKNTNYCRFEEFNRKKFLDSQYPDGRYWALNFNTSGNTLELRLFRGCLDYKRFLAYLQFAEAVSYFVKSIGVTSLFLGERQYKNNSWLLFTDWCKETRKYNALLSYLRKEKLICV